MAHPRLRRGLTSNLRGWAVLFVSLQCAAHIVFAQQNDSDSSFAGPNQCSCQCCESEGDESDCLIATMNASSQEQCSAQACKHRFPEICLAAEVVSPVFHDCECICTKQGLQLRHAIPVTAQESCSIDFCIASMPSSCVDADAVVAKQLDCECACCEDDKCPERIVHTIATSGQDECNADACRRLLPHCPADGEGEVLAGYLIPGEGSPITSAKDHGCLEDGSGSSTALWVARPVQDSEFQRRVDMGYSGPNRCTCSCCEPDAGGEGHECTTSSMNAGSRHECSSASCRAAFPGACAVDPDAAWVGAAFHNCECACSTQGLDFVHTIPVQSLADCTAGTCAKELPNSCGGADSILPAVLDCDCSCCGDEECQDRIIHTIGSHGRCSAGLCRDTLPWCKDSPEQYVWADPLALIRPCLATNEQPREQEGTDGDGDSDQVATDGEDAEQPPVPGPEGDKDESTANQLHEPAPNLCSCECCNSLSVADASCTLSTMDVGSQGHCTDGACKAEFTDSCGSAAIVHARFHDCACLCRKDGLELVHNIAVSSPEMCTAEHCAEAVPFSCSEADAVQPTRLNCVCGCCANEQCPDRILHTISSSDEEECSPSLCRQLLPMQCPGEGEGEVFAEFLPIGQTMDKTVEEDEEEEDTTCPQGQRYSSIPIQDSPFPSDALAREQLGSAASNHCTCECCEADNVDADGCRTSVMEVGSRDECIPGSCRAFFPDSCGSSIHMGSVQGKFHECECACQAHGVTNLDTILIGAPDGCTVDACREKLPDTCGEDVDTVVPSWLDCNCACCSGDTCPEITVHTIASGGQCSPAMCRKMLPGCPLPGDGLVRAEQLDPASVATPGCVSDIKDGILPNPVEPEQTEIKVLPAEKLDENESEIELPLVGPNRCTCECCDPDEFDGSCESLTIYSGTQDLCNVSACKNAFPEICGEEDAVVSPLWHSCECQCRRNGQFFQHTVPRSPPETCSAELCEAAAPIFCEAADEILATDLNCDCSCCTHDFCPERDAQTIGTLSEHECTPDMCRKRLPWMCPEVGDYGEVDARFVLANEPPTSPTSTPPEPKDYIPYAAEDENLPSAEPAPSKPLICPPGTQFVKDLPSARSLPYSQLSDGLEAFQESTSSPNRCTCECCEKDAGQDGCSAPMMNAGSRSECSSSACVATFPDTCKSATYMETVTGIFHDCLCSCKKHGIIFNHAVATSYPSACNSETCKAEAPACEDAEEVVSSFLDCDCKCCTDNDCSQRTVHTIASGGRCSGDVCMAQLPWCKLVDGFPVVAEPSAFPRGTCLPDHPADEEVFSPAGEPSADASSPQPSLPGPPAASEPDAAQTEPPSSDNGHSGSPNPSPYQGAEGPTQGLDTHVGTAQQGNMPPTSVSRSPVMPPAEDNVYQVSLNQSMTSEDRMVVLIPDCTCTCGGQNFTLVTGSSSECSEAACIEVLPACSVASGAAGHVTALYGLAQTSSMGLSSTVHDIRNVTIACITLGLCAVVVGVLFWISCCFWRRRSINSNMHSNDIQMQKSSSRLNTSPPSLPSEVI